MASEDYAKKIGNEMRAISVAQFFEKNKHLLGFDNLTRALLTSVKEAVDNSLDACEEADILPDISIQIQQIELNRYKMIVEDNGPGIIPNKIGEVFAKLLFGSKFQTFGGKQGRGQQGIGISAVVLYAQNTTGKPARIITKTKSAKQATVVEVKIDVMKNEPIILSQTTIDWKNEHGTRVEVELEAKYVEKKASVSEYLKETAIVNPHASIKFIDPKGNKEVFKRVTDELPKKSEKMKPHPYGMELGTLERLLKATNARVLSAFLTTEFDKVGSTTATEILKAAGLDPKIGPKFVTIEQADKLIKAMHGAKIQSPSTSGLSPIGAEILKRSLESEYKLDFACSVTRTPSVYKGNAFVVEVALGYGGELDPEGPISLFRFANRVPLLYQQGACALTKAATTTSWKNYGISQSGNNMPTGPLIVIVHVASVWAPFTSESKDAVASIPEIVKETKLALQECGRLLGVFIGKKNRSQMAAKKREMFKNYSIELARELSKITDQDEKKLLAKLLEIAEEMYKSGQLKPEEEEAQLAKIEKRKVGAFKKDKDEEGDDYE